MPCIHRCLSELVRAVVFVALCSPMVVRAAEVPLVAATAVETARPAAPSGTAVRPLDLRTPPISEVMTEAQIHEVLSRTQEPRNIENVEVDRSRVYDPVTETYIPPGLAALFWAVGTPSGILRLFTPRVTLRSRDNINPTNPSQPAPGIPAMAGEMRPFDR